MQFYSFRSNHQDLELYEDYKLQINIQSVFLYLQIKMDYSSFCQSKMI